MNDHLQAYLRRTTAHGFNHLAARRTCPCKCCTCNQSEYSSGFAGSSSCVPSSLAKLAWVTLITASFILSGLLVVESLMDTHSHPIATATDFVPIQEVPFPAVTIASTNMGRSSFQQDLLQQLEFDCGQYRFGTEDGESCMERSRELRLALEPKLRSAILSLYGTYVEFVKDDDGKDQGVNWSTSKSIVFCQFLFEFKYDIMQMMVKYFSNKSEDSPEAFEDVQAILLESFRAPEGTTASLFQQLFSHNGTRVPFSKAHSLFHECIRSFQADFGEKAKAWSLTLMKLESDLDIPFSVEKLDLDLFSTSFAPNSTTQKLLSSLEASKSDLVSQYGGEIAYNTLYRFVGQSHIIFHTNSKFEDCHFSIKKSSMCDDPVLDEKCCQLERNVSTNYTGILKLMKYNLQPTTQEVKEMSDQEDLLLAFKTHIPKEFKKTDMTYYTRSVQPVVLTCRFGDYNATTCPFLSRSLTSTGIGHTVNAPPFWNMYKKMTNTEIFFKEIVAEADDTDQGFKFPLVTQFNGPHFAMELLIDLSLSNTRTVAIHDAWEIPDLSGEIVELQPGVHTTILVIPTLIRTDNGLLEQTLDRKNCYSWSDGPSLELFKNYKEKNCLFECYLKQALDACGCIPWEYPRWNNSVPICRGITVGCFLESIKTQRDPRQCPQCRGDCETISYTFNVLTKPLVGRSICRKAGYYSGQVHWNSSVAIGMGSRRVVNVKELKKNVEENGISYHFNPGSRCPDFVENNMAGLNVHIGPAVATRITRSLRVTFSEQLANLGGVVALFTGMSVLSVFEFVAWAMEIPLLGLVGRGVSRVGQVQSAIVNVSPRK